MANIKITDLCPAGSDLFADAETYISDLSDGELSDVYGGLLPLFVIATAIDAGVIIGLSIALYW